MFNFFIISKEKQYFKRKCESIQCHIWDLEFKRFKGREMREGVRQAYDNSKQKLQSIEANRKVAEETGSLPKEEIARLDDQIVLLKRDIEGYESQMRAIDLQIDGSKRTNEYPEGFEGVEQTLESLRELLLMAKDYASRL